MKKLKTSLLILFLSLIGSQFSYGQNNFFKALRFDANLDISNKKRSYGVYTGKKYAKTGGFVGLDFGIYYQTKSFDYGMEYFTAYNHFNTSVGYNKLILSKEDNSRITPDIKFGYSPLLKKVYYGFGINLNIKWFTIGYSKLIHVKSGSSKYHGDGLNIISAGVSLKLNKSRKQKSTTVNNNKSGF
jgi:hypothetical protein